MTGAYAKRFKDFIAWRNVADVSDPHSSEYGAGSADVYWSKLKQWKHVETLRQSWPWQRCNRNDF